MESSEQQVMKMVENLVSNMKDHKLNLKFGKATVHSREHNGLEPFLTIELNFSVDFPEDE